ncbi:KpsF/GutQ family sugar-phosphate isomerase [Nitrospirillum viridazoti]|uniref:Arabinose-5-phosphate isomerase n=1 Tax=Nitrospirillum amazonense TaxID=28077 RepID=A0A560IYN9_9PROT|nr:KpsF/GutQ family sugar-phosphate isomerase [Nitrospirillum amazonense]TWB64118.1 arabinose-5-phosphate isomerase [Nitrospirillum amazonense]
MTIDRAAVLAAASDLLRIEANAVLHQVEALDGDFLNVVEHICGEHGNTLVAGIGKSGLVARQFASKLASIGARAFYYSAIDSLHGELGLLREGDLLILLSNSGQTQELVDVAKAAQPRGAKVAAMVGRVPSTLSRMADWTLKVHVESEATDTKLPTASTTAMLAFADALVVAVATEKGFTAKDFGRNHPGGTLGVVLGAYVDDLMARAPDHVALVGPDRPILETLLEMTRHPAGAALVVDADDRLLGLITDGDIRRGLARVGKDLLDRDTRALMTPKPRTCRTGTTAMAALAQMESPSQVYVLPVVDADNKVLGLLRMHDLAGLDVARTAG